MLLSLSQVGKSFGRFQAVSNVTFSIDRGELVALIGPNGAGKSTLFNLVTGFLRPSKGKIAFEGKDIAGLPPHEISRLGIVVAFQLTNIFPRLSVFENVQMGLFSIRGRTRDLCHTASKVLVEETKRLISEVGLAHTIAMQAQSLPHPDKKRLEIAMALACNPKLLLLDEPTSGQSAAETTLTMNLIKKLHEERGMPILFVEHKMPVVFGVAKRIICMHLGNIIADGSPESVRRDEGVQKSYLGQSL